MPHHSLQASLNRRGDLDTAKRQAVFLVSITTTILILWPQNLRIYRDLCIVPLLSWLTALAFDLITSLCGAWENTPYWLKYFIPVDMNVQIAAPFDQISKAFSSSLATASLQLHEMALVTQTRVAEFKRVLVIALINWLLRLLGQGTLNQDSKKSRDALGPAPALDQWYGVLVTTPPIHDYGFLGTNRSAARSSSGSIVWESYETSSIPSICPASTFRVHISFCLVPKAVWECPSTMLVDKFKAGLYWEKTVGENGYDGDIWTEERVRTIEGIEVLGSFEEGSNPIDACHNYFALLRQDWNYMNISWNDVDFAIILGFLVTGPQAAAISKKLFSHFVQLRIDQSLIPRDKVAMSGFMGCWCVSAAAGALTVLTGGLAAPITVPVFVGSCFTGMGLGIAGSTMSARDASMWQKRDVACRNLLSRFHQLDAVFHSRKAQ